MRRPNSSLNSFSSRQKREKRKKFVISLIFFLIIAILALFVVLIFSEVFGSCEGCKGCTGSSVSCAGRKNPSDTTSPDDTTAPSPDASVAYTDKICSEAEIHTGDLILINNTYKYVFPKTSNIVPVYSNRTEHKKVIGGVEKTVYAFYTPGTAQPTLDASMLVELNKLTDAFYTATGNNDLFVNALAGYRTADEQTALYNDAVKKYGADGAAAHQAPAGATEHHTGKCIDLSVFTIEQIPYNLDDPANNGAFDSVYRDAYKYGFILRYPADKTDKTGVDYDKYHFRYVGYPHAYYMQTNNLCLEEYLNLLKTSHATDMTHLIITGDNGVKYAVYYTPASDITTVKVPQALPYTLSGDNMGGFIVTVTLP